MNSNKDIFSENPFSEKKKIINGLELKPIKMRHYHIWLKCKPILTLRMSSLPIKFATMPYISAIYAMETISMLEDKPLGFLSNIAELICLSAGLDSTLSNKITELRYNKNDPFTITSIAFRKKIAFEGYIKAESNTLTLPLIAAINSSEGKPRCEIISENKKIYADIDIISNRVVNENLQDNTEYLVKYNALSENAEIEFTPRQFNAVRKAIAELNGAELPNESQNTELIEALNTRAEILERQNQTQYDYNLNDMLDSVAYASGLRISDLADWDICEFERRKKTVNRAKYFEIYGISEMNGCEWKGGNPYPSWIFEKSESLLGGFTPINEILGKVGGNEQWLNAEIENSSKE